jgi:hypothetical protein
VTVIDGGLTPGVVVSFTQGEGPTSALQGFTIQNGAGDEGGGITVQGASPTITGNRIVNNSGCSGAGIGVGFGNPIIQGNTISGNKGTCGGLGGGGIEFRGASTGKVLNNVITGNSTVSDGGGIVLWAEGAVTLRDNIITGNTANGTGGGIATVNSAPAIIVDNLIAGNKANGAGALSFSNPYAALINNTIAGNQSTGTTAAAVSGLQASFDVNSRTVGNLIIAAAGQLAVACGVYGQVPINGTFKNNDVFAAGGGPYGSNCVTQTGSQGNISADPLFVNAAAGNYRLQSSSPALNAGDASAPELGSSDLDGNPRFRAGKVDMGAYEYPGATSVTISPASISFPQQAVGSSSDVQAVTITNTGPVPFQVASIATTGDYSQTSTSPTTSSIPTGGNCIVTLTFAPTARGSRPGTLTIVSNAATSPSVVYLSGTAVGAVLNLSSSLLTFPNQLTDSDSPPQQLTLTNSGDYPLAVSRHHDGRVYADEYLQFAGRHRVLVHRIGCVPSHRVRHPHRDFDHPQQCRRRRPDRRAGGQRPGAAAGNHFDLADGGFHRGCALHPQRPGHELHFQLCRALERQRPPHHLRRCREADCEYPLHGPCHRRHVPHYCLQSGAGRRIVKRHQHYRVEPCA